MSDDILWEKKMDIEKAYPTNNFKRQWLGVKGNNNMECSPFMLLSVHKLRNQILSIMIGIG